MVVRSDIIPGLLDLTEEQAIEVQKILGGFTDTVGSRGTYLQQGERLRQPKPAQDIDGFTDLVSRVILEQQISEDVPLNNRIQFLEDFPPGDITTELITFGLVTRVPGSLSRGQHMNQRVREVKPHIRGIEDDPTKPGYKIITLGQKFENEILLTCWAKTNKRANWRARWLEDTLRNWTWYIRHEGVEDFYFIEQERDIVMKLDGTNNTLKGRPLRYWIRTERLSHVLEPTIRRIVVKYGLGQPQEITE